jgi:hypothetical protein
LRRIYSRYYGIDYAAVERLSASAPGRGKGPSVSAEFDDLCGQRTSMNECGDSWIVRNGATIEQAQILATHNVAQLMYELGLYRVGELVDLDDLNRGVRSSLNALDLGAMTTNAFNLAVWKLRVGLSSSRPLGDVKDAAYAWRQLILYLCVLDSGAQVEWIEY